MAKLCKANSSTDVPGPPSGVEVAEVGPQHLAVTWTTPQDSNAPITAYIVTVEPQSSAGERMDLVIHFPLILKPVSLFRINLSPSSTSLYFLLSLAFLFL